MKGLDVIVTSHNTRDLLADCLNSLKQFPAAQPMRVTVIDNGSTDGSAELVKKHFPRVQLAAFAENRGFGPATNHGLRHLQHEKVLLLNGDTRVTKGCIDQLIAHLDRNPEVGLVGPRQTNAQGQLRPSCGEHPTLLREADRWRQHHRLHNNNGTSDADRSPGNGRPGKVGWLSGSAVMIRREVFRRVGVFDESFFLYFEDIDLCRRAIQAGFQVHYLPAAGVIHHGGASAASQPEMAAFEYRRSQILFWNKHGSLAERAFVRAWIGTRCLLRLAGQGDDAALQRRVLQLVRKGVS